MADIDQQGRKPEDIPPVAENPNPVKTVNVEKNLLPESEQKVKTASDLIELVPSKPGNEMVVLVQLLSSLNRNIAFLATTVSKYVTQQEQKKNG